MPAPAASVELVLIELAGTEREAAVGCPDSAAVEKEESAPCIAEAGQRKLELRTADQPGEPADRRIAVGDRIDRPAGSVLEFHLRKLGPTSSLPHPLTSRVPPAVKATSRKRRSDRNGDSLAALVTLLPYGKRRPPPALNVNPTFCVRGTNAVAFMSSRKVFARVEVRGRDFQSGADHVSLTRVGDAVELAVTALEREHAAVPAYSRARPLRRRHQAEDRQIDDRIEVVPETVVVDAPMRDLVPERDRSEWRRRVDHGGVESGGE